jgi:predicted RNA binding protein YcfA (HicA-like mRNA interferase family)
MPDLPAVSGEQAAQAFLRAGWVVARRANHIILTKPGSIVSLSVPSHPELAPGTLRKLIRLAGLSIEEFARLVK